MSLTTVQPGLMILHSNRPERLRELLVHWYAAHPPSPLETETLLVQSNGMAQWLKMALAADVSHGGCGIAAMFDMLLPSRFVWQAYRAVLGPSAVPEVSPFDPTLLVWRLMRLLPELLPHRDFERLARYLQQDHDGRKLHQLALTLATGFDQYQIYRADWLAAWEAGQDHLTLPQGNPLGLAPEQRWQARLWRALLSDIGPDAQTSRCALQRRFLDTLSALDHPPPGLPRRLTVFGLSSLPNQHLEVLHGLSRFCQVMIFVHNPCRHYWADLVTARTLARRQSDRHARKVDLSPSGASDHPLLASWGHQGRDYIAALDERDQPEQYRGQVEALGARIDVFEDTDQSTLLGQLQNDMLNLNDPGSGPRRPLDAHDPSLRFHSAHSPQREVEILHDQLLALFNSDASWRPRDVLVMMPDVNLYAPHIDAVFGQIEPGDKRRLPYTLADQSRRRQSPLAGALETLLSLPDARLSVSDMLELLEVAALRRRFGLCPEDLPLVQRWIRQTQIRWGIDGQHRQTFSGRADEQNTWMHGLRQMLLGYAQGADPSGRHDWSWQEIEPYGEVAGLEAALAGTLAHLLERLQTLRQDLARPASPATWAKRLQTMLQQFFDSDSLEDERLLWHLSHALQPWSEACHAARLTAELDLAVVRDHWLSLLDESPPHQRFMGGQVTFATLMPMRAIPFRMVCLLGMNDGDFPRHQTVADFDLLSRHPRRGDRSRREDDRYLFLEALLSARERLYISWVGRSIQDNAPRPPSVLVSQLRDHLERGWFITADRDPGPLLRHLTVEHRLQPFHPDYFGHGPDASWLTYAREWEPRAPHGAEGDSGALPPLIPEGPISLLQLSAFLKDPVGLFYRQRLGIHFASPSEDDLDHEPFKLDALSRWLLQDELIEARADGLLHPCSDQDGELARQHLVLARLRRRGLLPLEAWGDSAAAHLTAPLEAQFAHFRALLATHPERHSMPALDLKLTWQARPISVKGILGECCGAASPGSGLAHVAQVPDRLLDTSNKPRHAKLLAAWVKHLALHLQGQPLSSILCGIDGAVTLCPLEPGEARRLFHDLIEAYLTGLTHPWPLAPKTGFTWLNHKDKSEATARIRAQDCYEGTPKQPGERQRNPYLQRHFPTFEALWSNAAMDHACQRLYAPLMDVIAVMPYPDMADTPS